MSDMTCLHCQATTSNGLALCGLCQRFAKECLSVLPIYFGNLARWRPGRAGSRPVPGSRVLYDGPTRTDGTGDRISDRLDEAANALTTRARELVDDRPQLARLLDRLATARREERIDEAQAITWLCKGFERYLTTVATLGWAGDFVRDLSHHEAVLRGLTEQSIPGWYAGACQRRITMESICGADTFVVPGLTWVKCGRCGATTYARDHLDVILKEARDWQARPKALAEAIVALVDTEPSVPRLHDRIRKWDSLEWLTPTRRLDRDGDPVGPKRYRFGDVLDLVLGEADAPTRAKRASTA